MAQAIFGLVGVILGGVLTGGVAVFQKRLDRQADARQACRLIDLDLATIKSLIRYSLRLGREPPEEMLQEHLGIEQSWELHRATLARTLSADEWFAISRAVLSVEGIRESYGFSHPDARREAWEAADQRVVEAQSAIKHRVE